MLERRLEGREYLVDTYSIADIANFCWVKTYPWSGIEIEGLPRLEAWLDRIAERPAVQRGLAVPGEQAKATPDDIVASARNMLV